MAGIWEASRRNISDKLREKFGTSLAIQEVRLCASTVGDAGSTPAQGTRIDHVRLLLRRTFQCLWQPWHRKSSYQLTLHSKPTIRESRLSLLCLIALFFHIGSWHLIFSGQLFQETEKQDLKIGFSQQPESKTGPFSQLNM